AAAIMRRSDRAFRIGGDEFAVLLPSSDLDVGLAVGRRILAAALGGGDPTAAIEPFSLSIGVSAFPTPTTELADLQRHAESAVARRQRHGRTAVVAHAPGLPLEVSANRRVAQARAD